MSLFRVYYSHKRQSNRQNRLLFPDLSKTSFSINFRRTLPAGFTRIKYLGLRKNDRARMCYIELIGNPIEIFEKNETDA